MLTRRQLLNTIAAAPLARFCRTEPVRPYDIDKRAELDRLANLTTVWTGREMVVMDARDVERRYALPQGTLG